jgi:hypothetical protein
MAAQMCFDWFVGCATALALVVGVVVLACVPRWLFLPALIAVALWSWWGVGAETAEKRV